MNSNVMNIYIVKSVVGSTGLLEKHKIFANDKVNAIRIFYDLTDNQNRITSIVLDDTIELPF